MDNFRPNASGTLTYTANGTPQNFALPSGGGLFIRVQNSGANIGYGELSNNANGTVAIPTATAGGGWPVFANLPAQVTKLRADDTRIALISAGNSTIHVTRGDLI